jgi:hypothetical protein
LRPARPIKHGRFFYSKARDCARCPLRCDYLSKGRVNKAVVVGDHYPALLRARRRRERWSAEDLRLYQRHRWRSEGFHGEAKTWHGPARAVRRGLANMKIQAYLTARRDQSEAAGGGYSCTFDAMDGLRRLIQAQPPSKTNDGAVRGKHELVLV